MNRRVLQMIGFGHLVEAAVTTLGLSRSKLSGASPQVFRQETGDSECLAFSYSTDASSGVVLSGNAVFTHGSRKCVVTITCSAKDREPPQMLNIISCYGLSEPVKLHD